MKVPYFRNTRKRDTPRHPRIEVDGGASPRTARPGASPIGTTATAAAGGSDEARRGRGGTPMPAGGSHTTTTQSPMPYMEVAVLGRL